ncbi:MAG: glycosyltransferase [bacterium]|nr:glycosyltransferase [bacterium]
MPKSILVVPCYNEASRLQPEAFQRYVVEDPATRILFVNDGSTDTTLEVLHKLEASDPAHLGVLDLQPNRGKAEAVRRGMLAAFADSPQYVGYWDADLATPLEEFPDFVHLLDEEAGREVIFGARVALLGRQIHRRAIRHYLGRVFATVVSNVLDLRIYDTQCGAKLFRASDDMKALFEEPFSTNWVFDVEILARLIRSRRNTDKPQPAQIICEHPLKCWRDVAGSKVRSVDFFRALAEIALIYRRYLAT